MNYKKAKYSCYYANLVASSVFCFPPMLFVTFREMYGISYTLLGTLVLINFCTQMIIDLIFTFFTRYFNIHLTIRTMPLLTSLGIFIYALVPWLFPQYAYFGLALGTVVFSVAAGLGEVLLSPLVAAIPSDNPGSDMSFLHSLYAYGVLSIVIITTIFIKLFGAENWRYLVMFFAILPIISSILFFKSPMPKMEMSHEKGEKKGKNAIRFLAFCTACIFLGSAAENVMTNWISGYFENALKISKTVGDIVGMAVFAIFLGLGRKLYAKYGKNIIRVLFFGMVSAAVCYVASAVVVNPFISVIACVLVGFCTSMLWPGTLILMEEKIPRVGVAGYALMAAGGDLGASVAPQLVGIVVDKVSEGSFAYVLGDVIGLSTEQIGMRAGMLVTAVFPSLGAILLIYMMKRFKKQI